jgi:hypothetical protein
LSIFRSLGNPETALLKLEDLSNLTKIDRLSLQMMLKRFNKDREGEQISLPDFV